MTGPQQPGTPLGPAPQSPAHWTLRRKELLEWFKKKAPSLADAYAGGVELLARPDFPARVHFIAHAVRGIRNRLPDFLSSPQRQRLDYSKHLGNIAEVWPTGGPDGQSPYASRNSASPPETVPVPRKAFLLVDDLVTRHGQQSNERQESLRMFELVGEAGEEERAMLEPVVNEFYRIGQWFMDRAHLRIEVMPAPDETELCHNFERFETTILSIVRQFFKTTGELDEILQDANA